MFEENSNTKGFLLGFITGSVIGSLAALLYAPKPGRELREEIAHKKDELLEDTGKFLDNAKSRASEMISEGRKAAANFLDETRSKAESLADESEKTLNQGKERVTNELNKMKDSSKTSGGSSSYSDERNKSKLQ